MANVAVEADPDLTPSAMRQKYAAAHEQISHDRGYYHILRARPQGGIITPLKDLSRRLT
jgi:hypothetical protein